MRFLTVAATLAVSALFTPAFANQQCRVIRQCQEEITPPPRHVTPPPRVHVPAEKVCSTACLTEEEWRNCPTKRWWASSKGFKKGAPGAHRSQYIYARCGTVCAVRGAPSMWYHASTGRDVWFHFK